MIRITLQQISERTKHFAESMIAPMAERAASLEIADGNSLVGGGSTPSQSLPTKLLRIASQRHSATQLEERLRAAPAGIPVIARIEDDRLLIDLRTVFEEQEGALAKAILQACS